MIKKTKTQGISRLITTLRAPSFWRGFFDIFVNMKIITQLLLVSLFVSGLTACNSKKPLFSRLDSIKTGISFRNDIKEDDSLNVFTYEYIYNGGGVGVGDVNNDGKPDVFLAGNQVSSKLYLNQSGANQIEFKDITAISKTTTNTWCTGVAMIDINQDGWLDIYVSTAFPDRNKPTPNLLFLNEGLNKDSIPTFREVAAQLGLADSSYATQAVFFDYDRDGDLDVYLCNNAHETFNRNEIIGQHTDGKGKSQDKLMRNNKPPTPSGNTHIPPMGGGRLPTFTDVSKEATIQTEGWGLGVIVKDFNADGWPDIYVANDFQSNDLLYINNQKGGFENKITDYLTHQSHNSMGVDMADFNNDGLEDICVVDMLPEDNVRQKTMFSNVAHDKYEQQLRRGYQPQFVRNMLQLNNGPRPNQPYSATFSDIGYLAGVAATDWSWSPLFADFNMDGWRDLLITNGYVKDVTDMDFTSYANEYNFGGNTSKIQQLREKSNEIGTVKKPNWLFINNQDLTFTNKANDWGLPENTYSNGAAYADFDDDGDLDLIMNNLNDEAFVYQNNSIEGKGGNGDEKSSYFLKIKLLGNFGNLEGIGAKITIWHNSQQQYAEHALQRGYLSTVENTVYFGLGKTSVLDSIEVQWLSGKRQVLNKVIANQTLKIAEENALLPSKTNAMPIPIWEEVTKAEGLAFLHQENDFMDFNYQPTLPHRYSRQGPKVAVGDVNGDGLEDFYVAGASRHSGYFFIQTLRGFAKKALINNPLTKRQEETGVLLFDADNDGDLDLYCVAGGNEFADDEAYQDLLFLNDGKGSFIPVPNALPQIEASGSCVIAADYDKDGDLDLFIGGRVVPKQWPKAPRSYILRNDGGGFTDVTAQVCPQLMHIGMVTDAIWADLDKDTWPDLAIVGEFMPFTIFKNNKKTFELQPLTMDNGQGWYNTIAAADFDKDGDTDFVLGNLGLNTRYKASKKEPVRVRAKDFDNSGSYDAFLSLYNGGREYLTHPRGTIVEQIAGLKRTVLYYNKYGKMGFNDLFTKDDQKNMYSLQATQMASVYVENQGDGKFAMKPLPTIAQVAPIQSIVPIDFDNDGQLDIVAVGNSYTTESLTGRYDAAQGWMLRGDGKGNFTPLTTQKSGFLVRGDARSLVKIRQVNGNYWLLTSCNADSLHAFTKHKINNL